MPTEELSQQVLDYIEGLRPSQRSLAREWAREDDDVFKARMGVALDSLSSNSLSFKVFAGLGIFGGGFVGGFVGAIARSLGVALL